jgi:DNA-binding transcriptional ArsR family regulator
MVPGAHILNYMVEHRTRALDRLFRALASEPRREILRLVSSEPRSVTELSACFDMSLAAVSKHVQVLEQAELITQTKDGRHHWCRLNPEPLKCARASIDELSAFWDRQLGGLEDFLTDGPGKKR